MSSTGTLHTSRPDQTADVTELVPGRLWWHAPSRPTLAGTHQPRPHLTAILDAMGVRGWGLAHVAAANAYGLSTQVPARLLISAPCPQPDWLTDELIANTRDLHLTWYTNDRTHRAELELTTNEVTLLEAVDHGDDGPGWPTSPAGWAQWQAGLPGRLATAIAHLPTLTPRIRTDKLRHAARHETDRVAELTVATCDQLDRLRTSAEPATS